MASLTSNYNTVVEYLTTSIQNTTGFDNVTVSRGWPNVLNTRPSANIQLAEPITIDDYVTVFERMATIRVKVGLDVLWQEEETLLDNIQGLIDEINENGRTQCAIDSLWVTELSWSEEEKKYSRVEITVTAQAVV